MAPNTQHEAFAASSPETPPISRPLAPVSSLNASQNDDSSAELTPTKEDGQCSSSSTHTASQNSNIGQHRREEVLWRRLNIPHDALSPNEALLEVAHYGGYLPIVLTELRGRRDWDLNRQDLNLRATVCTDARILEVAKVLNRNKLLAGAAQTYIDTGMYAIERDPKLVEQLQGLDEEENEQEPGDWSTTLPPSSEEMGERDSDDSESTSVPPPAKRRRTGAPQNGVLNATTIEEGSLQDQTPQPGEVIPKEAEHAAAGQTEGDILLMMLRAAEFIEENERNPKLTAQKPSDHKGSLESSDNSHRQAIKGIHWIWPNCVFFQANSPEPLGERRTPNFQEQAITRASVPRSPFVVGRRFKHSGHSPPTEAYLREENKWVGDKYVKEQRYVERAMREVDREGSRITGRRKTRRRR